MAVHEILATPPVRAPAFPTSLDWINTGGEALTLEGLLGKIVLLDFWKNGLGGSSGQRRARQAIPISAE